MTDKELRKLNRAALLELLLAQSKEAEDLRQQLSEANEKLESRCIELQDAGNIAEAALALNGVFSAAQAAADQYLESIKDISCRQEELRAAAEAECSEMKMRIAEEARAEADRLKSEAKEVAERMRAEAEQQLEAAKESSAATETEAKEKAAALLADAEKQCAEMKAAAEAESAQYWKNISERLEKFYAEHAGLRELLGRTMGKED